MGDLWTESGRCHQRFARESVSGYQREVLLYAPPFLGRS